MRRPVLPILALVALGCERAPTQIIVAIDSDLGVPAEVASVRAVVKSDDDTLISEHAFALTAGLPTGDEVALPFSFGVAPGEDREARVIIEAHAVGPQGSDLFTRRAITRFVEHESLVLPMFLARACASEQCPVDQTCTELGCRPEEIDPATLERLPAGRELDVIRRDAGLRDAEVEDEDATTIDGASSRDASDSGRIDRRGRCAR